MKLLTEHFNTKHSRDSFDCGIESLNKYLHQLVSQDLKRNLSVCYVILEEIFLKIKGFYTLSSNSIPLSLIPDSLKKKLPPNYQSIPVILIGRFAIDKKYQSQGLGKILLIDALYRCYLASKEIGIYAIVVDPINEDAVKFYAKYGFILLPSSEKMFIPVTSLVLLFES